MFVPDKGESCTTLRERQRAQGKIASDEVEHSSSIPRPPSPSHCCDLVHAYLARVGEDHDFDRWVGLELLNHPHDLLHHSRRQAVAGLLILHR